MEQLLPYALTTLQRVKDLIFDPNSYIVVTGDTASGSNALSSLSDIDGIYIGMVITGLGIPQGTTITSIGGSSATMSNNATADGAGVTLTVINQAAAFDLVLTRMINSVTDFVERECNGKRFVQTLFAREMYSATGPLQKHLVARNAPITFITSSGATTLSSPTVTGIPSTAGMKAQMPIQGDGIAPQTVISAVVDANTITLSSPAVATLPDAVFQVSGLISFEWRAGTPTFPSWTSFILDQYELVNDGKAGIVRIYGVMPRLYSNSVRLTYYAGYLVDWANAGNYTTHTLPSDISSTVENLVVRRFKRRFQAGKSSEALEGATTSWRADLDIDDKAVLSHYKRMPVIF